MNTNDHINKLIKIGLPESEAKVYFYLLKKKNFTAAEIAKLSHVSRSKIYEVLSKLVQKGLCTETLGKVKKYSPVNPEVVFDDFYNGFEEKKKIVSDLSKSLMPLFLSEKENTDPLDYIQIIREKNAIAKKFNSLQKKAEKQILYFSKGPYVVSVEKNIEGLNALKRGVITRTIFDFNESIPEEMIKEIESFIEAGEEIKFYQNLPIKMVVFDNAVVMLALVDRVQPEKIFTTMVVHHPDIAESFSRMFEDHWQKAMNFNKFILTEKT